MPSGSATIVQRKSPWLCLATTDAQVNQAGDFGFHVAGVEVDVHPVLPDLRLRYPLEPDVEGGASIRRRPEAYELVIQTEGRPTQRGLPERDDAAVVRALDDDGVGVEVGRGGHINALPQASHTLGGVPAIMS